MSFKDREDQGDTHRKSDRAGNWPVRAAVLFAVQRFVVGMRASGCLGLVKQASSACRSADLRVSRFLPRNPGSSRPNGVSPAIRIEPGPGLTRRGSHPTLSAKKYRRASGLASRHYRHTKFLMVARRRHAGRYHDQLPNAKSASQNRTHYGNDSV